MLQQFSRGLLCSTNLNDFLLYSAEKAELWASKNKAILSESAFSIKLVNSFSCALDLSLNLEITKPSSNQVSLSRFIGTVITFGEGRSITSLIHSFSAFLIGFVSFFRMAVISLTVV